jgi:hypothetical protein
MWTSSFPATQDSCCRESLESRGSASELSPTYNKAEPSFRREPCLSNSNQRIALPTIENRPDDIPPIGTLVMWFKVFMDMALTANSFVFGSSAEGFGPVELTPCTV